MQFYSVLSEDVLVNAIKLDCFSEQLSLALRKFDAGETYEAHSLCDQLKGKTTLAIMLSALFSKDNESESDFLNRHITSIQLAAEKGNSLAQYSMGVYYETGELVEQNQTYAEACYKNAAEQGMPLACYIYGTMLYYAHNTENVPLDPITGLKLLNIAAENGIQEAKSLLDSIKNKRGR